MSSRLRLAEVDKTFVDGGREGESGPGEKGVGDEEEETAFTAAVSSESAHLIPQGKARSTEGGERTREFTALSRKKFVLQIYSKLFI